ncbi:MAG TPA: TatD family hydrolase [Kineosporiaceae bacterium]|nr:TatD family hydrolase [Kineosporiaceae bacterium]
MTTSAPRTPGSAGRSAWPPAPDPLPLPVVDDHTHLDHARRGETALSVDDALARAAAANVTRTVQIGCDVRGARWTVAVLDEQAERARADGRPCPLLGGVSLHPTEASRLVAEHGEARLEAALAEIERLARHPRVRVVGETGLDHYWVDADDTGGRAAQERAFRWHVDLAKRLGKVLQIHDRDAHRAVLQVLADEGAPERTVFHCFSGDATMARLCADRGWYLSFAGTLTFANAEPLREALRAIPLDRVLVETDAPYLAPVPHRGRPNAGYLVPLTVRCMAAVLDRDVESVCAALNSTSEALYGPW